MGRLIPVGSVNTNNVFPTNTYRLRVGRIAERTTKTGKLMFAVPASAVDGDCAGQTFWENFVIGTDDDPNAEELSTWTKSIGGKQFIRLLKSLNLALGDEEDFDVLTQQAEGTEFVADIEQYLDNGSDERFRGQPRNRYKRFYKLGEKEPGVAVAGRGGATANGHLNGKAAPTDSIRCASCPPGADPVPRSKMSSHIQTEHAAELDEAN